MTKILILKEKVMFLYSKSRYTQSQFLQLYEEASMKNLHKFTTIDKLKIQTSWAAESEFEKKAKIF